VRPALAERVAHAISLERAVITGVDPAVPEPGALVDELAHHLRALLRDVVCGHLDDDLVSVADALLEPEPEAEAELPEPEPEAELPEPEPEVELPEPDVEPEEEPATSQLALS
jgi:glyoxylase-like metal-dependent hydrolase (beta-lactamase superfamily II)